MIGLHHGRGKRGRALLTVRVSEAGIPFSELLDKVANGAIVTITRHGTPVAALLPISQTQQADIAATVRELKEFGRGQSLDIPIRDAMEDGRR